MSHWLYVYGYKFYDTAIIGEYKVWTDLSQTRLLADFEWNPRLQMPVFRFNNPRLQEEQYFYLLEKFGFRLMNTFHLAEEMFLNTVKGVNLNAEIFAKLTEEGEEILLSAGMSRGVMNLAYKKNEVGYRKFQLWDFMNIFGKHMYNGAPPLIENNMIYFQEEKKAV